MALQQAPFNAALQNAPINLYNFQAPGTPYAQTYSDVYQTLLLAPDIDPNVIPTFPSMFTDMAFFMSCTKRGVDSLAYQRFEKPWINVPIQIRAGAALVSPVAATVVSQTVPIEDNSYNYVSVGDKVFYPDGTNGMVTAKTTPFSAGNNTLTIGSLEGEGLPAVVAGQELRDAGPWRADGFSTIYATTMPEYILYDNVLENSGAYAVRWDRVQKHQMQRKGNVDMVADSIKDAYTRAMVTWQARLIMSQYGRTLMPDGVSITTSTSGLLEQQADAGVQIQTVSSNQAVDAIREIVFDTALNTGGTKVILGTRRLLQLIGQNQKADKVRYTPEDTRWNMDVYEYEFFGHRTVLVPMDQWTDRSLYGDQLQNDLLVLNKEDIIINYLNGMPMMSRKHTLLNVDGDPGNLFNFDLVWYEGLFGLELRRAWATGRIRIA